MSNVANAVQEHGFARVWRKSRKHGTEGQVSRMSEICDKCLTCHWYCDDVLEECKGQEESCHEYSPCMEIRGVANQMDHLKAKIHDACLDHESEILDLAEMLGDQRNKNYETGRIEDIDLMIPILNGIEYEVERYREYIKEIKNEL